MRVSKSLSGKRPRPSKRKRPRSAKNLKCKNASASKKSVRRSLRREESIVRRSRLNATLTGPRNSLRKRRFDDKSKRSVKHASLPGMPKKQKMRLKLKTRKQTIPKMKPRLRKMRQHGTIMRPHLEILQRTSNNLKRSSTPKKLLEPTKKNLLSQIASLESLGRKKNLRVVAAVGVVEARTPRWNIDLKCRLLRLLLIVKISLERMKKIYRSMLMTQMLKILSPLTRQMRQLSLLIPRLHTMPKKRRRPSLTNRLSTTLRSRLSMQKLRLKLPSLSQYNHKAD